MDSQTAFPPPPKRRSIAWPIIVLTSGLVGCSLAVLSVRSFFVSDSLSRWRIDDDAVLIAQEDIFPPPTQELVSVRSGLRIFTLRTGRGRLQLKWQDDRPNPMITHSGPPALFDRWIRQAERPAKAPWSASGQGWGGWSIGGVGMEWTTPASTDIFHTTEVGLPLPLLSILLLSPLLARLVARFRNRQRRGFELNPAAAVVPSGREQLTPDPKD